MNILPPPTVQRLRLETPAGQQALTPYFFEGSDYLNQLFEYRIEAVSSDPDLDFDQLLGSHATMVLDGHAGARIFDGIITRMSWMGADEQGNRYDLTLRPWFWLAGQRRNQRIFHNKTVVQMVREILLEYSDMGAPAFDLQLLDDYPVHEYTVQYQESDLDFICRQLERHGISFHFCHEIGNHCLVLTDSCDTLPSIGERDFHPRISEVPDDREHFWTWRPERKVQGGMVRLTDWNFTNPMAQMETAPPNAQRHQPGKIESFDFPGDYTEPEQGKARAMLRTHEAAGGAHRLRAIGNCLSLGGGMIVALGGEPAHGTGRDFLCIATTYSFRSTPNGNDTTGSHDFEFIGSHVLIPADSPMVPPRRTPVPVIHGPQTAIVAGQSEIDCDEYGRILLRFHWDQTEARSMRCRVSQNWAGGGWGGMAIPRVGMEVVVEFLEGNPDRPLVTGCVYNGQNQPPHALPLHQSRSTFRTKSVGGTGHNELSFEDQAGQEFISIHAQRELRFEVGHSHQSRIGHDSQAQIGHDCELDIKNDRRVGIGGDAAQDIRGNRIDSIGGDWTTRLGRGFKLAAGDDLTLKSAGEVVIEARRITLITDGAAVVIDPTTISAAPTIGFGGTAHALIVPTLKETMRAAAGAGMAFVAPHPANKQETT